MEALFSFEEYEKLWSSDTTSPKLDVTFSDPTEFSNKRFKDNISGIEVVDHKGRLSEYFPNSAKGNREGYGARLYPVLFGDGQVAMNIRFEGCEGNNNWDENIAEMAKRVVYEAEKYPSCIPEDESGFEPVELVYKDHYLLANVKHVKKLVDNNFLLRHSRIEMVRGKEGQEIRIIDIWFDNKQEENFMTSWRWIHRR